MNWNRNTIESCLLAFRSLKIVNIFTRQKKTYMHTSRRKYNQEIRLSDRVTTNTKICRDLLGSHPLRFTHTLPLPNHHTELPTPKEIRASRQSDDKHKNKQTKNRNPACSSHCQKITNNVISTPQPCPSVHVSIFKLQDQGEPYDTAPISSSIPS